MRRAAILAILATSSCSTQPLDVNALESAVSSASGTKGAQFDHAPADLNNDSRLDAVVLLRGTDWCGSGGCTMLIFQDTQTGYSLVSRSTVTSPPIRVLQSSHMGWNDLIVRSNSVGDVLLQFDGNGYPSNPSLEPIASPRQIESAQDVLGRAPNNSFKPSPLRGLGPTGTASGGPA